MKCTGMPSVPIYDFLNTMCYSMPFVAKNIALSPSLST